MCIKTPINEHCENCQVREFIFEGEGTLESFVHGYLKSEIKATPQFPITFPIMTGNLF